MGSTFSLHAWPENLEELRKNPIFSYSEKSALAFLGVSLFILFYRRPLPDAKPEYEWKKLFNFSLLANNPKAYLKNLWRLYYDGIIGQTFKDKYMVVQEDKTVKQSRVCLPFGVFGHTFTYLKTAEKMQQMMGALGAASIPLMGYRPARDGILRFFFGTTDKDHSSSEIIKMQKLAALDLDRALAASRLTGIPILPVDKKS